MPTSSSSPPPPASPADGVDAIHPDDYMDHDDDANITINPNPPNMNNNDAIHPDEYADDDPTITVLPNPPIVHNNNNNSNNINAPSSPSSSPPDEESPPELAASRMPAFERCYRHDVLRPLSGGGPFDGAVARSRRLLTLDAADFADPSAEEAFRRRLLPATIRCVLHSRVGEDRRVLTPRGEAAYRAILTDFCEASARRLSEPGALDELGRDWLDALAKAFGDGAAHPRGGTTATATGERHHHHAQDGGVGMHHHHHQHSHGGGRGRSGNVLPSFYHFYGHERPSTNTIHPQNDDNENDNDDKTSGAPDCPQSDAPTSTSTDDEDDGVTVHTYRRLPLFSSDPEILTFSDDPEHPRVSSHLRLAVDCFLLHDGLKAIERRVDESEEASLPVLRAALDCVVALCSIPGAFREHLIDEAAPFRRALARHLEILDPGARSAEDRRALFALLDALADDGLPGFEPAERYRQLRLERVWRTVADERGALAARAHGLNELRDRVADAARESAESEEEDRDAGRAACEQTVRFLTEERDFLATLLSPSWSHPELLKRAAAVVSFLAERAVLTDEDVVAVWNAANAGSVHESVRHAVLELLMGLLERLGRERLTALGRAMEERLLGDPERAVTEKCLLLVHHYANVCLGIGAEDAREVATIPTTPMTTTEAETEEDPKPPLGLKLLWTLAQESTPLRRGLHEIAVSYLLTVTDRAVVRSPSEPAARAAASWLTLRAVEGIRDGRDGGVPCQLVLNNVLRLTLEEHRAALVERHRLVDSVVRNVCRYSEAARRSCLNAGGEGVTVASDGSVLVGRHYGHAVSISSKLEFLKFLLGIRFDASSRRRQRNVAKRQHEEDEDEDEEPVLKARRVETDDEREDDDHDEELMVEEGVVTIDGDRRSFVLKRKRSPSQPAPNGLSEPIVIEDEEEPSFSFTSVVKGDAVVAPSPPVVTTVTNNTNNNTASNTNNNDECPLSPEHVEALWSHLVEKPSTPQETDLCLSALRAVLVATEDRPIARDRLAAVLFRHCTDRLPVKPMRTPALELFVSVMARRNLAEGRYELVPRGGGDGNHDDDDDVAAADLISGRIPGDDIDGGAGGASSVVMRVVADPVSGVDRLWRIVLDADNEDVAGRAAAVLSAIHAHATSASRRRFVRRCVDTIREGEGVPRLRCLRLITVHAEAALRRVSCGRSNGSGGGGEGDESCGGGYPSASHGYTTRSRRLRGFFDCFHVRLQPGRHGAPSFEVKCRPGATVRWLRRAAAMKDNNHNVNQNNKNQSNNNNKNNRGGRSGRTVGFEDEVRDGSNVNNNNSITTDRLIYRGRELLEDEALLTDLGIADGVVVHCWPRKSPQHHHHQRQQQHHDGAANTVANTVAASPQSPPRVAPLRPPVVVDVDERRLPRSRAPSLAAVAELVEPRHVRDLFALLTGHGRRVRRSVWDLLQLLPTDPESRAALSRLDTPCDWSALVPPVGRDGTAFRSLYALQVVESLAAGARDDVPENWSETFAERGGVDHLARVLLETDLEAADRREEEEEEGDEEGEDATSPHLLFLLRCVHRLQQLLVFFLEERADERSESMRDADDSSEKPPRPDWIRPLASHTLRTLHHCVCVQRRYWTKRPTRSESAAAANSNAVATFPHYRDDAGPEYGPHPSPERRPSPPPHSKPPNAAALDNANANDIPAEAGAVASRSLSLLRLLAADTSSSLVSSPLLSDAVAAALVGSPSDEVRRSAASTLRSVLLRSPGVVVGLLPLGRDAEFMERCGRVFDAASDALSDAWHEADEKERGRARVSVDDALRSAPGEAVEDAPTFHGIGKVGEVMRWVVANLLALPVRERRRKDRPVDHFLVGLLRLADFVLRLVDDDQDQDVDERSSSLPPSSGAVVLVNHVFFDCLHTFPSEADHGPLSPPKCKTSESRDAAAALLATLCRNRPANAAAVSAALAASHHSYAVPPRRDLADEWHFDPSSRDRCVTGHVGLRNLGATCYVNSLLQQLFLIRPFRNGVLSCECGTSEEEEDEDGDAALLPRLQSLLANLLLSERRDVDTSGLCAAVRGYDGQPVRPGEQQDAVEFFNLFGDRLETSLRPFPQRYLLQDVFGGELCHSVICQECRHRSERSEDCLSLSLDVKGKSDVHESLRLYTRGEQLDGDNRYFCEKCQAKRDSLKTCCVSALPNTLVLHLKRFEFDLEIMRKIKVNDRFEYPLELDMGPFTKEGVAAAAAAANGGPPPLPMRPDDYYRYRLRGVLVHSGTADSGHYYSLARDGGDDDDDAWYCFNDSCVTPFDVNSLPSATFGGTKMGNKYDHLAQKMIRAETPKPYSAYLLIYERRHVAFADRGPDAPTWRPSFGGARDTDDPRAVVPPDVFRRIWAENDRFLRDRVTFSPTYGAWVTEIARTSRTGEMVRVATHLLLETSVHGKDQRGRCAATTASLCAWYAEDAESCRWLLDTLSRGHRFWIEKILLLCPVADVRRDLVRLLTVVFRRLATSERALYYEELPEDEVIPDDGVGGSSDRENDEDDDQSESPFDADDDVVVVSTGDGKNGDNRPVRRLGRVRWWRSKSVLARFVGSALLNSLPDCELHWRRFEQLFETIHSFALLGHEEALYLVRCGCVLRLVDVWLGENGGVPPKSLIGRRPTREVNGRRPRMGDKYSKPNMRPLVCILDQLIRSCVAVPEEDPDDDDDDDDDSYEDDERPHPGDRKETMVTTVTTAESPSNTVTLRDPPSLTPLAAHAFESTSSRYELPRRDVALVTTKKFLQTLLEEPSLTAKGAELDFARRQDNDAPCVALAGSSVRSIVCHVCLDDRERTRLVCDLGARALEDRKADEFAPALESLLALLFVNDDHVAERATAVTDALVAGVASNLKYEKESTVILNGLSSVLRARTRGERGTAAEVALHDWMLESLGDRVGNWFRRPNTIVEVRQSIVGLSAAVLPMEEEEEEEEEPGGPDDDDDDASDRAVRHANVNNNDPPRSSDDDVVVLGVVDGPVARPDDDRRSDDALVVPTRGATDAAATRPLTTATTVTKPDRAAPTARYKSPAEVKRIVFFHLLSVFDIVVDTVRCQASHGAAKTPTRGAYSGNILHGHYANGGASAASFVDSTVLAVYFRTLRRSLTGADHEVPWLSRRRGSKVHARLTSLLWKIDEEGRAEQRPSADVCKGEILMLYERIVELHPEVGEELVRNFPDGDSDDDDDDDDRTADHAAVRRRDADADARNDNTRVDRVSKLLEIYVTSVRENDAYNARYMSHYYGLLVLLASRHTDFRRRMLDHNNWRWSLRAFVLSGRERDRGAVDSIILGATVRYVDEDEAFREAIMTELASENYEGGRRSLLTQTRLETGPLRLLLRVLDRERTASDDRPITSAFVDDHQGLRQLSAAASRFHRVLDHHESGGGSSSGGGGHHHHHHHHHHNDHEEPRPRDIDVALEGLSLALECVHVVLNSFGMNRVRTMLSRWSEVDDVNFLCHRLYTRSAEEWESLTTTTTAASESGGGDDDHDDEADDNDAVGRRRLESMRVVEHASEVLRVLASAETIAEAESG